MRKWTYLVAALLMSGATATFTSCIDTDEPAGIEELRGAKAELLRAKAAVEQAEAAIRTAQAAWVQAQADIAAQYAAQQELVTALQQAANEREIAQIQAQIEINAANNEAALIAAQQRVAEAQANYDKALIDIEVALVGYRENAYAASLYQLLNSTEYRVSYEDAMGATQTRRFFGLNGINSAIRQANENLALYMRQLNQLQASYDISTKIAATEQALASAQGELEGMQEKLTLYQDLLATGEDADGWRAQYEELQAQSDALDKRADEIDVAIAQAEAPFAVRQDSLNAAKSADVKKSFTVVAEIQTAFYNAASVAGLTDITSQADGPDAEGNYTFPDYGIELENTLANLKNTFITIVNTVESEVITDNEATAAEGQKAQYDAQLALYITADEATDGTYEAAVKAWQAAKAAYNTAYTNGKYYDEDVNDRAQIIKDFEQFQDDLANPEIVKDAITKTPVVQAFLTKLNDYLAARKTLDGFEPATAPTFDNLNDGTWYTTSLTSDDARFGSDIAAGIATYSVVEESLYGAYVAAADELGYSSAVDPSSNSATQVETTYEEWVETNSPSYPATASANLTDKAYAAKFNSETITERLANREQWQALLEDVTAIADEITKAQNEQALCQREIETQKAAATAELTKEKTANGYEKSAITTVKGKIETALKNATEDAAGTSISATAFDDIIAYLESEIETLQGGDVNIVNDDWNFTTTGSIPQQEVVIASYEQLLAALNDGTYVPEEDTQIAQKEAQIEALQAYIEALDAVYQAALAKKDALLAALTGGAAAE